MANLFSTLSSGQPYDYSAAFCDSERFNSHGYRASLNQDRHRKSSFFSTSKRSASDIHAQRSAHRNRLRDQCKYELFSVEEKVKSSISDPEKGSIVPGADISKPSTNSGNQNDDPRNRGRRTGPSLYDVHRLLTQRVSLLGKPIDTPHAFHRTRDQIIRKYQFIVHSFLERPRGKFSVSYHIFL